MTRSELPTETKLLAALLLASQISRTPRYAPVLMAGCGPRAGWLVARAWLVAGASSRERLLKSSVMVAAEQAAARRAASCRAVPEGPSLAGPRERALRARGAQPGAAASAKGRADNDRRGAGSGGLTSRPRMSFLRRGRTGPGTLREAARGGGTTPSLPACGNREPVNYQPMFSAEVSALKGGFGGFCAVGFSCCSPERMVGFVSHNQLFHSSLLLFLLRLQNT